MPEEWARMMSLYRKPSPQGNAIKLSGRTFFAPHRGRGGYVAVLHESVEISIASDYST